MADARQQFKAAWSGVRAMENLPSKTTDLIKPDVPRYGFQHGENKAEMVKALMALRDLPPAMIDAAWEARQGQYISPPVRPMRPTRDLRYYTTAAKKERDEAERRRLQRRDWHECAMRGCEQCSAALRGELAKAVTP